MTTQFEHDAFEAQRHPPDTTDFRPQSGVQSVREIHLSQLCDRSSTWQRYGAPR